MRLNPTRRHAVSRGLTAALTLWWAWGAHPVHAQRANMAAAAAPRELQALWAGNPSARLFGKARLRFMGFTVYDIRLWTPAPQISVQSWPQQPFALELEYALSLSGRAIAERSLQEMERAGPLPKDVADKWQAMLEAWIPDVIPGDRLTGVHAGDGSLRLFHNGTERAQARDPELARRFFGIWLGAWTSEPRLRDSLLAGAL